MSPCRCNFGRTRAMMSHCKERLPGANYLARTRELFTKIWDNRTDFSDFLNADPTSWSSSAADRVWEVRRRESHRQVRQGVASYFPHFTGEEIKAQKLRDSSRATQALSGGASVSCQPHLPLPVLHTPAPSAVLCRTRSCFRSHCWRCQAHPYSPLFHISPVIAKVLCMLINSPSPAWTEGPPSASAGASAAWLRTHSHHCGTGFTCCPPFTLWIPRGERQASESFYSQCLTQGLTCVSRPADICQMRRCINRPHA